LESRDPIEKSRTVINTKLCEVILTQKHRATGKTWPYVLGQTAGLPSKLCIAQYPNDSGYYLFYYGANGEEINDTYHDTLEEAKEQAAFAFTIADEYWVILV
jgi:hypothetical protein